MGTPILVRGKLRKSSRQSGILRNLLNRLAQNALRFSALPVALFAFCAPAQAVDQNSISALSVSTGNGVTVIKVQIDATAGKIAGLIHDQYSATHRI